MVFAQVLIHCESNDHDCLIDYNWNEGRSHNTYYFNNKLTDERIPLTEAQYRDNNYTIERARQT